MHQRYYDPIAGRFLSVDPIVTDANTGKGFGLYTYVDNNPYLKVDPDGREPELKMWADPKGMTHAEATSGLRLAGEVALSLVPGVSSAEYAGKGQLGMAAAMLVVDLGPLKALKAFDKVADAAKGAATAERGLWKITQEGTERVVRSDKFGKIYKSESDGLWWAKDTAGHGGSEWKVFRENSKGLEWYRDADKYGDFIVGKHKGDVGKFVPWKELTGSGF